MKIFYDENMPYAQEFFGELGELVPFAGRTLTREIVADADALLVRSITEVNQLLLEKNNRLQFVGTATIGVNHIDQNYLAQRDISFSSAPGCNAISVAEYVISSLVVLSERYQQDIFSLRVGIVGAGNTGSRLGEKLSSLGIEHYFYDPFLAENVKDKRNFVSLDKILTCDVISLHVPLTKNTEYPTYHMFNLNILKQLTHDQILINACRGEVIDNKSLLKLKQDGLQTKLVLDVWENEPDILHALIPFCEITTAHIAGYSLEGKARGTEMLYQALCKSLDLPVKVSLKSLLPSAAIDYVEIKQHFDQILLNQLVKMVYDVRRDDAIFRQQIYTQGFDTIRKTYPARREFSAVRVSLNSEANDDVPHDLGFSHPSKK